MKRILTAALAAAMLLSLFLLTLTGCDAPGVYKMNDILPPLIDQKTQLPYLEKIAVTQVSSGQTVELTEPDELNLLRMQLEGIKAIRDEKAGDSADSLYSVVFFTPDGETEIRICSAESYILDGSSYDIMVAGIDLFYFDSLFAE